VIRQYRASAKFQGLADESRRHWGYLLNIAELPECLGAYSSEEIRPALVQAWLDGFADRPAQQKCARAVLRAVEKWAVVRDLLPWPITTGTEAPGSIGGHKPWTDEQVELAELHVSPPLGRVITLASNTGQRCSDIVKMRWSDIEIQDGRAGINVVQQKTGVVLWIPFTQRLAEVVAIWERRPTFLALKKDDKPWTAHQASSAWLYERDRRPALAPLKADGLVLHGLRATAVVRLRRAGATTGQIKDMVGMSEQMVNRYCRLSEQRVNALAAVHHLDAQRPQAKGKKG